MDAVSRLVGTVARRTQVSAPGVVHRGLCGVRHHRRRRVRIDLLPVLVPRERVCAAHRAERRHARLAAAHARMAARAAYRRGPLDADLHRRDHRVLHPRRGGPARPGSAGDRSRVDRDAWPDVPPDARRDRRMDIPHWSVRRSVLHLLRGDGFECAAVRRRRRHFRSGALPRRSGEAARRARGMRRPCRLRPARCTFCFRSQSFSS